MTMKSIATMLGFVAVALGPIPSSVSPMAGIDAAYAEKGGNGNSGGGNSGGGNSGNAKSESKAASKATKNDAKATKSSSKANKKAGKNDKGALASELKGLNAVKANPNAFKNAAPNSQVGRIAAYRDAAIVTSTAATLLAQAAAARDALPLPVRSISDIDAAIALLDPTAAGYSVDAAALATERQSVVDYTAADAKVTAANTALLAAQSTEDAALLVASGGRELSDEAIAYIRDQLDL